MKSNEIEVFVHSTASAPIVAKIAADERLEDFFTNLGLIQSEKDQVFAFVGEGDEALQDESDDPDREDEAEPVKLKKKVQDLGLKIHDHVHCYRCRKIAVTVHFGSDTKKRKFNPAASIATVTRWARKRFHLNDAAADELVLQICETTVVPRPDQRLGELKEIRDCAICFNLVKEITPQG